MMPTHRLKSEVRHITNHCPSASWKVILILLVIVYCPSDVQSSSSSLVANGYQSSVTTGTLFDRLLEGNEDFKLDLLNAKAGNSDQVFQRVRRTSDDAPVGDINDNANEDSNGLHNQFDDRRNKIASGTHNLQAYTSLPTDQLPENQDPRNLFTEHLDISANNSLIPRTKRKTRFTSDSPGFLGPEPYFLSDDEDDVKAKTDKENLKANTNSSNKKSNSRNVRPAVTQRAVAFVVTPSSFASILNNQNFPFRKGGQQNSHGAKQWNERVLNNDKNVGRQRQKEAKFSSETTSKGQTSAGTLTPFLKMLDVPLDELDSNHDRNNLQITKLLSLLDIPFNGNKNPDKRTETVSSEHAIGKSFDDLHRESSQFTSQSNNFRHSSQLFKDRTDSIRKLSSQSVEEDDGDHSSSSIKKRFDNIADDRLDSRDRSDDQSFRNQRSDYDDYSEKDLPPLDFSSLLDDNKETKDSRERDSNFIPNQNEALLNFIDGKDYPNYDDDTSPVFGPPKNNDVIKKKINKPLPDLKFTLLNVSSLPSILSKIQEISSKGKIEDKSKLSLFDTLTNLKSSINSAGRKGLTESNKGSSHFDATEIENSQVRENHKANSLRLSDLLGSLNAQGNPSKHSNDKIQFRIPSFATLSKIESSKENSTNAQINLGVSPSTAKPKLFNEVTDSPPQHNESNTFSVSPTIAPSGFLSTSNPNPEVLLSTVDKTNQKINGKFNIPHFPPGASPVFINSTVYVSATPLPQFLSPIDFMPRLRTPSSISPKISGSINSDLEGVQFPILSSDDNKAQKESLNNAHLAGSLPTIAPGTNSVSNKGSFGINNPLNRPTTPHSSLLPTISPTTQRSRSTSVKVLSNTSPNPTTPFTNIHGNSHSSGLSPTFPTTFNPTQGSSFFTTGTNNSHPTAPVSATFYPTTPFSATFPPSSFSVTHYSTTPRPTTSFLGTTHSTTPLPIPHHTTPFSGNPHPSSSFSATTNPSTPRQNTAIFGTSLSTTPFPLSHHTTPFSTNSHSTISFPVSPQPILPHVTPQPIPLPVSPHPTVSPLSSQTTSFPASSHSTIPFSAKPFLSSTPVTTSIPTNFPINTSPFTQPRTAFPSFQEIIRSTPNTLPLVTTSATPAQQFELNSVSHVNPNLPAGQLRNNSPSLGRDPQSGGQGEGRVRGRVRARVRGRKRVRGRGKKIFENSPLVQENIPAQPTSLVSPNTSIDLLPQNTPPTVPPDFALRKRRKERRRKPQNHGINNPVLDVTPLLNNVIATKGHQQADFEVVELNSPASIQQIQTPTPGSKFVSTAVSANPHQTEQIHFPRNPASSLRSNNLNTETVRSQGTAEPVINNIRAIPRVKHPTLAPKPLASALNSIPHPHNFIKNSAPLTSTSSLNDFNPDPHSHFGPKPSDIIDIPDRRTPKSFNSRDAHTFHLHTITPIPNLRSKPLIPNSIRSPTPNVPRSFIVGTPNPAHRRVTPIPTVRTIPRTPILNNSPVPRIPRPLLPLGTPAPHLNTISSVTRIPKPLIAVSTHEPPKLIVSPTPIILNPTRAPDFLHRNPPPIVKVPTPRNFQHLPPSPVVYGHGRNPILHHPVPVHFTTGLGLHDRVPVYSISPGPRLLSGPLNFRALPNGPLKGFPISPPFNPENGKTLHPDLNHDPRLEKSLLSALNHGPSNRPFVNSPAPVLFRSDSQGPFTFENRPRIPISGLPALETLPFAGQPPPSLRKYYVHRTFTDDIRK